jgi:hypothetical protein
MRNIETPAEADLKAGFPVVYCDANYPETMEDNNLMIEEHPNGDRFIVAINMDTREITTIRQIPPKKR